MLKYNQHFLYVGTGSTGSLLITRNIFYACQNCGGAVKVGANSYGRITISFNTFDQNAPYDLLTEEQVSMRRPSAGCVCSSALSRLKAVFARARTRPVPSARLIYRAGRCDPRPKPGAARPGQGALPAPDPCSQE